MKVLFIVPYPSEGASNRFRIEQYLPYLERAGIYCSLRPFFSQGFYRILYKKGYFLKKLFFLVFLTMRRVYDVLDSRNYDMVFIHREAFPFGSFIECFFKVFTKKIIYDFDDALFLPNVSDSNRLIAVLKDTAKVKKVIKISSYVIAGNNFLRDYALNFKRNVTVLSTPIDTDRYVPLMKQDTAINVVIGWMGSATTVKYLNIVTGVFAELFKRYPKVNLIIIGGCWNALNSWQVNCREWALASEIRDLQSFDIGIMPLTDDDWSRGKCAFKAIEYMSVGIPVVASDVGMNKEVIQNGINGFLVTGAKDWVDKLALLIEDPVLRHRMGAAGRKLAEEKFSLKVNAPKFLNIIREVYGKDGIS